MDPGQLVVGGRFLFVKGFRGEIFHKKPQGKSQKTQNVKRKKPKSEKRKKKKFEKSIDTGRGLMQ